MLIVQLHNVDDGSVLAVNKVAEGALVLIVQRQSLVGGYPHTALAVAAQVGYHVACQTVGFVVVGVVCVEVVAVVPCQSARRGNPYHAVVVLHNAADGVLRQSVVHANLCEHVPQLLLRFGWQT